MIEEFVDGAALASAATEAIVSALDSGLRRNGSAAMVATGGRSPGPVYDALSVVPIDWGNVRVTLSDERWVDADSPDSNEGLVRRRLLRGRAADADFFSLRGHEHFPEAAAHQAWAILHGWPPFDVVMLGMGEDGHVASLFPGHPALAEGLDPDGPSVITVPDAPPPQQTRLSLSIRPIVTASQVVILTSGAAKRAVLEQALGGAEPSRLPVAAVLRSAPSVRILWTREEARA